MINPLKRAALPLLCVAITACAPIDPTTRDGAVVQESRLVDTLPETLGTEGIPFTGVVIYGDKGYTGVVGSTFYPGITVNDRAVGKCVKRQAFVVPLAPGNHVVVAKSEGKRVRPVTLAEGDVAYFRCSFLRIGGVFQPPPVLEQVDRQTAYETTNVK